MAPRANWKGTLKIAEVSCPVALYTAASTSDRISFHTINRATGNRVQREYVDSETGKPVSREDQVKGYALSEGEHIILQPEEIAAAIPDSDKTLTVEAFLPCGNIDDVYFDKPYYLAPSGAATAEAFALIRIGLATTKTAAIARTVLFRRMRTVMIRAHGDGLIATTLNFDYEVRSVEDAFSSIAKIKMDPEMLDLASHIINTKTGTFDPSAYEDRYENAVAELVKAKAEGRKMPPKPSPKRDSVIDLKEALRQSAQGSAGGKTPAGRKKPDAPKRKAG